MSMSIGGSMPPPPPPPPQQQAQALTEEEETALEELLAEYDASSLTDAEAEELVSEISELGIEPGKALGDALANAGFDPGALAEQAGLVSGPAAGGQPPNGPPPAGGPPPSGGAGATEAVDELSTLVDLLEAQDTEENDAEDWQNVLTQLEELGLGDTGSIFSMSI